MKNKIKGKIGYLIKNPAYRATPPTPQAPNLSGAYDEILGVNYGREKET